MQDEVNSVTFLLPRFLFFLKEVMQDHIQRFLVTSAL